MRSQGAHIHSVLIVINIIGKQPIIKFYSSSLGSHIFQASKGILHYISLVFMHFTVQKIYTSIVNMLIML